jgi:hypothetical protein
MPQWRWLVTQSSSKQEAKMFGLPEWAVGVGTILVLVTALQIIYVRLMPPEQRRRRWKGEPVQVPEDVQRRLAELDDVKQRLGELEERVDFAERVLARQRESERLGPS